MRIYIAGHTGLIGQSLMRRFRDLRGSELVTANRTSLDLTDFEQVREFFEREKINGVINAAGRVGGIAANAQEPVEFLVDNMSISLNLLRAAHEHNVEKFINLASSCSYSPQVQQPMAEEDLFKGELEPTSASTSLAKLASIHLCESYRVQYDRKYFSVIPANVYGPGETFDADRSHVIPALIKKFHQAKTNENSNVEIWGTGKAIRDFVFVDDVAAAIEHLLEKNESENVVNIPGYEACSIAQLAREVAEVVGYEGEISYDNSKPDGSPDKRLSGKRLRSFQYEATTPLREGLQTTYDWALSEGQI